MFSYPGVHWIGPRSGSYPEEVGSTPTPGTNRRMGSRYKNKTPSLIVRGAEIRLQAYEVRPKAHDTNGLRVNAENKDTAKKYLKRQAKIF